MDNTMNEAFNFEQIVENMPMVTMRLHYEGGLWKTWYVSKNIERYGFSWDALMSGRVTWRDLLHPDDRVLAEKLGHDYMAKQVDSFKLQYRIYTPTRESVWITEYSRVNRTKDGSVHCVDSFLINTTEANLGEQRIEENIKRQMVLNDILLGLHDADLDKALQIILDRTGAYLNTSRALLLKDSPDHKACEVMYEWLNQDIAPIEELGRHVTYSVEMPEIHGALQKTGMFLVNANEIPESCRREFEKQSLVSSAIFAVYLHGEHYGFVCFDDCVVERTWDVETAAFLKNISNLISTVLTRVQTEKKLKTIQRTCETVLDNIDSYIFASHPETSAIIFANRAFRNLFGSNCLGKDSNDYISLRNAAPHETKIFGDGIASAIRYELELERTGKWLSVTRELVPWVDGQIVNLVNCHDITVKKQYEDRITRLAYMDHLTDLPNRYGCDAVLRRSLADSQRTGEPGYLLFIDLDDFKVVNDCYGHDFGDGVLISFAQYVRSLFSPDNHVFRFGGDEFVIIINQCRTAKLHSYLDQMLARSQHAWASRGKAFHCTLSVGAVEFPAYGDEPGTLLKKADIAMYQAKKKGKNQYAVYTEGLDSDATQRSEVEHLLRNAMLNHFQGFEVFYQLYNDTHSRNILGAEALVRMRSPDGELLLPEQFLSLAEYLGLIGPLGEFVLSHAAEQCRLINEDGLEHFSVTVNLSAKQFKQTDIVHRLEEILNRSGVDFGNIIIAINEGVAIGELERMLVLCGELRKKGIRVALDDFGSGNASFINMRNLPVDIVKVSSKYIDTIQDEFTGYFIRLVTDVSHHTGKKVCLNGVENKAQLDFCREIGMDMAQGFLLHRPEDITALWASLHSGLTNIRRQEA